jgi:hypothetical protein
MELAGSVGLNGRNLRADIRVVQVLLNAAMPPLALSENGAIGPATIAAIEFFQRRHVGLDPDGRIDVGGRTWSRLAALAVTPPPTDDTSLPRPGRPAELTEADFAAAAAALDCGVAAIKAVAEVESRGAGFLASGRPAILFEAQVFSRLTRHAFDRAQPDISTRHWKRSLYKGGEAEYPRLEQAMALSREAALASASWGKFQVMGFNAKVCGYDGVETFVAAMFEDEARHLMAFVNFINANNLARHLRALNWVSFARAYNGSGFERNRYDTRMAAAYARHSAD